MSRYMLLSILIILAGFLVLSCSDDDCTTCPEPTPHVTGQVLAYFCGIGDINNNMGELRYSVRTGLPAYVTLTRLNGRSYTLSTDDSSSFDLYLDKGVYEVSIDADYIRPVVVANISISGDTAVDLKAVYDFYTDGHYLFGNFYYPDGDSIGQAAELTALNQLCGSIGNVIDRASIARDHVTQLNPGIHVSYRLPVVTSMMNWTAFDSLYNELTTHGGTYPSELSLDPGNYICMY